MSEIASRGMRLRAVVLGALLALLAAEVLIRTIHYYPRYVDPDLGPTAVPGSRVISAREGFGHSRWTTNGVRRATAVDPKRRPILVLGDSFTEAVQVDDAEVYTHLLEHRLVSRGMPLDVVNAGHAGFSAADYVLLAERNKRLFEPRWTVIQLRAEDIGSGAWDPRETHFVERDGRFQIERGPVDRLARIGRIMMPALRHSALLDFGFIRVAGANQAQDAGTRRLERRGRRSYPSAQILGLMADAYDGRVTFLFIPPFDARHPERVDSKEEASFTQTCVERSLSCVNLRAAYPELARGGHAPFGFPNSGYNLGHWNQYGHRAGADLLGVEITRLIHEGRIPP